MGKELILKHMLVYIWNNISSILSTGQKMSQPDSAGVMRTFWLHGYKEETALRTTKHRGLEAVLASPTVKGYLFPRTQLLS